MCFVWIWEQTAIISLYNINWLTFGVEARFYVLHSGGIYLFHFPIGQAIILRSKLVSATSCSADTSGCFSSGKSAVAWNWPLISGGYEWVELHLHSLIRVHSDHRDNVIEQGINIVKQITDVLLVARKQFGLEM